MVKVCYGSKGEVGMTKHEAIEVLEEVKMLDDSMFAYSQAYNDALDMAIEALKAQEPRIVTIDDFKDADGCGYITAWCEASNELFADCITIGALEEKNFRYWTSRPTDEQREATPWMI